MTEEFEKYVKTLEARIIALEKGVILEKDSHKVPFFTSCEKEVKYCAEAEKQYYKDYDFVRIYNEQHGGTGYQNYLDAGKRDGRFYHSELCN